MCKTSWMLVRHVSLCYHRYVIKRYIYMCVSVCRPTGNKCLTVKKLIRQKRTNSLKKYYLPKLLIKYWKTKFSIGIYIAIIFHSSHTYNIAVNYMLEVGLQMDYHIF